MTWDAMAGSWVAIAANPFQEAARVLATCKERAQQFAVSPPTSAATAAAEANGAAGQAAAAAASGTGSQSLAELVKLGQFFGDMIQERTDATVTGIFRVFDKKHEMLAVQYKEQMAALGRELKAAEEAQATLAEEAW